MFETLIIALAGLVIALWIGFAYWVNKDARRRSRNLFFVGFATLLGLVAFVGPLVYLLFRPAETRADVQSRMAELAAFQTLAARREPTCPECSAPVDDRYIVCPVCTTRLREPCAHCDAPLERLWQMCPYCATPVTAELDLDAALTQEAHAVTTLTLAPDTADEVGSDVGSFRSDGALDVAVDVVGADRVD
ncbi:MAG TPA: zinc ribbon domain-containing protein [Gaiellaceae bacterium]